MRTVALLVLLGGLVGSPARVRDELRELARALRELPDPAERLERIPRLVELENSRTASILARLVREDPDATVRLAAAEALGPMRTDNARKLLLEALLHGNIASVRSSLARGLASREDGLSTVLTALEEVKGDVLARQLLLESLVLFDDDAARATLLRHASGKDPDLASVALRALRRSERGRALLVPRLRAILEKSRDRGVLLEAVDLLEDLEEPSMRPLVERLKTFLEPDVRRAAAHLAARLKHVEAVRRARLKAESGYGARTPPPPPPARPRYDLVFVVDVTGSTVVVLPELRERIRREMRLLRSLDASIRVGIVGYRMWKNLSAHVTPYEILPLTFDGERVERFLEDLRSRGPDSRGANISGGLQQGLARMSWREEAFRFAVLVADGPCHDETRAKNLVNVHFRGGATRTRVLYVLRTRRSVPPEMEELARGGGTSLVELLK
jgi:hypothetical protein